MSEQLNRFYRFGEYRIEAAERLLRRGEDVIYLQPKAVDLLIVLLENHGRVVSKNDLLAKVWENQFVEEANLSHAVFQLRKALGGKDFIETVPKRGYRFAADVKENFGNDLLVREQTLTRISVEEEIEMPEPPAEAGSLTQEAQNVIRESQPFSFHRPLPQAFAIKRKILFSLVLIAAVGAAVGGYFYYKRENKSSVQKMPPRFTRITNSDKMIASTISPDGKLIAYAQNYTSGEGAVYVRQIDMNREIRLIEPRESFFGTLSFSPDGAFVYFIEHKKDAPHGNLFRVSSLGGQPAKMVDNVNYMFALAPDGRGAVFFRGDEVLRQHYLTVAALDGTGSERRVLTTRYDEIQISACPAWSPDGRLIAFSAIEKKVPAAENQPRMFVFTVEIATGEMKKLSRDAWLDIGKKVWMPDGSGIVFVADLPRTGTHLYFVSFPNGETKRLTNELNNYGSYGLGITADGSVLVADLWESSAQIWTKETAGSNTEQITFGRNDGEYGIASLPDGSIVYAARSGDTTDLWKTNAGKIEPLTTDDFTESDVSAAPDGSFLIFASNRAGGSHLFRMEMNDLSLRQLTFGETFDDAPDISADGNWIVYNAGGTIRKIPDTGGDSIQVTDYTAITPAFSPDGTKISAVLPAVKVTENSTLAVISADGGKPLQTFQVIPFGWYYRATHWTADGQAVIFRKTEKSITNLWQQNLSGGAPQPLTDFKSDYISNYTFSRDRRHLILARGHFGGGVVMIRNLELK